MSQVFQVAKNPMEEGQVTVGDQHHWYGSLRAGLEVLPGILEVSYTFLWVFINFEDSNSWKKFGHQN